MKFKITSNEKFENHYTIAGMYEQTRLHYFPIFKHFYEFRYKTVWLVVAYLRKDKFITDHGHHFGANTFRKCKNLLSTIFMSLSVWLTILTPTAYRGHESNSTVPENFGCGTKHFSLSMFALYRTSPQPLIEPLTA